MSDTTDPISHVFDQTNGVIDGLEGESDGTAGSEVDSAADRGTDDVVPAGRDSEASVDASDGTASGAVDADRSRDRAQDPSDRPAAAYAVDRGADADRTGSPDLSESSASTEPVTDDGPATEPIDAGSAPDDSIGHVFDQTNGVADGLEGESDGTAGAEEASAGDRGGLNEPNPVGQQDAFHDDHYGQQDGRDPNP